MQIAPPHPHLELRITRSIKTQIADHHRPYRLTSPAMFGRLAVPATSWPAALLVLGGVHLHMRKDQDYFHANCKRKLKNSSANAA